MPRIAIYLNKELYDRAADAGLPITRICQGALVDALRVDVTLSEMLENLQRRVEEIKDEQVARFDLMVDRLVRMGVDLDAVFEGMPHPHKPPSYVTYRNGVRPSR